MSVSTQLAPTPKKGKAELAEQISFTTEQIQLMKDTVAKGATDNEFMLFMHLAQSYGLDPFLKEIWCLKYASNQPATVFTSRDGYLKIASRDKQMNGIQSDAVYVNDTLKKLVDGTVEHAYGNPRGELIGAYAQVHRKDRGYPTYFYAPLAEYSAGNNPTWRKYPSAMIIKVAEAMALKRAFSISGLVTQEEIGLDMQGEHEPETSAVVLANEPAAPVQTTPDPAEPAMAVATGGAGPLTPRTEKLIKLALDAYDCEPAKGAGAEQRLLDSLGTMTEEQGTKTLRWLEKQPKKKQPAPAKTQLATTPKPAGSTSLVDEFKEHPTADDSSPVQFATDAQKKEINRLIDVPVITRPEKTLVILNINRLDEARAQDLINKLSQAIDEREGGAGAAAQPAVAA